MRIFIVEDEPDILRAIEYNLRKEGFETESANDGNIAMEKIIARPPDLAILDVMLPGLDGITLCKALRASKKTSTIPIIMLTARTLEIDKVTGLESGADDYITKPFSIMELIARIRAILRRTRVNSDSDEKLKSEDLELDIEKVTVKVKNKNIKLTAIEFIILKELLKNKNKVLSRESILEKIWKTEDSSNIETRTVDVHIMNLRKKLGKAAEHLETVKNFGYSWRENV